MIHGLSKSREIVDVLHKVGLGISYNDVLMLRDVWALDDLTNALDCPSELAHGVPAIAIVDNDDFKMDTLTGAGQKAHRTNVMYVQPEHLTQRLPTNDLSHLNVSDELKRIGSEMQTAEPYKSTKKADLPVRQNINDEVQNKKMQQGMCSVIHALSRTLKDQSHTVRKYQSLR